MDSSGGQETSIVKPKPLMTSKVHSTKMDFGEDAINAHKSPEGGSSTTFSFKEQSNLDYLINRDPMQEFFSLTCQSIKLNSPHMNTICTIDTQSLY